MSENKVRDFNNGEEIIKRFNQISNAELGVEDINWLVQNINNTINKNSTELQQPQVKQSDEMAEVEKYLLLELEDIKKAWEADVAGGRSIRLHPTITLSIERTEVILKALQSSEKEFTISNMIDAWDARNEYKLRTGNIDTRTFDEWLTEYRKNRG